MPSSIAAAVRAAPAALFVVDLRWPTARTFTLCR